MNVKKLKGLMAERGESQKEIANVLGISAMQLNRKINGKFDFKVSEVQKLSEHYNVNPEIFLISEFTQKATD